VNFLTRFFHSVFAADSRLILLCAMFPVAILAVSYTKDSTKEVLHQRFAPPPGYHRQAYPSNSWPFYLSNLPLKPKDSPVCYYDGTTKQNDGIYLAVVALSIGKKDLHQCADAVIRLRAEHLFLQGKYKEIAFRQASGKTLSYLAWLGERRPDKQNLWSYLESVFNTANTTSLNQQLKSKDLAGLAIGDVFITPPPPGAAYGHAIIVVDKCTDEKGHVKFILAQSYMPAQEIQILNNPSDPGSPWYDLDFGQTLDTPEWTFTSSQLKSFE
jgi:hypothetical protein